MDENTLVWSKDKYLSLATMIRFREGGLYKVLGRPILELVHDEVNPSELWH